MRKNTWGSFALLSIREPLCPNSVSDAQNPVGEFCASDRESKLNDSVGQLGALRRL